MRNLLKEARPGSLGGKCEGSIAVVKQASTPLRPHQHILDAERGVRRSMVAMVILPSR